MKDTAAPPLVLIACTDEWMSRSFESVFEQNGYAVARVKSGARTLKLARRANPDVVVLEEGMGDLDALQVCSALANDPLFDHSIPIVLTSTEHVTTASRHAAYASGAWEYCSHPVDLEALMLKLATFQRGRAEIVTSRADRLVDRETGLYTANGLQRLAEQYGAHAQRKHGPFACVALALQIGDRELPGPTVAREDEVDNFAAVAQLCRVQSRKSDVVGHVSVSRLGILAPDTDAQGARLLVARLQRELDRAAERATIVGEFRLRAGYFAVTDLAAADLAPAELVRRAASALDHLQFADADDPLMSFDDIPVRASDIAGMGDR
jgi:CheY-like chemotaxis protein